MKTARVQTSVAVPGWLVLGSFSHADWMRLLDYPFLPEADVAPAGGDKVGALRWRAVESTNGNLDFLALDMQPQTYCVAYAFTYLHAAAACQATLLMGSDDGIAVWLNGEQVWRVNAQRACSPNEDQVPVRLSKGWNRLLVKVNQREMGWNFCFFVKSAAALRFSLKNPQPKRWPGVTPTAPRLGLLGIRIEPRQKASPTLAVTMFNHGTRASAPAVLSLTAGGNDVVRANVKPCAGLTMTTVELRPKSQELVAALAHSDAGLAISSGAGRSDGLALSPESIIEFLLTLLAGHSEAALVRLGEQFGQLLVVFPGLPHTHAANVRQALAAVARGDTAGAEATLKGVVASLSQGLATDALKGANVHVIGHAHIDMNWLWTWPETVKCSHDTFRQVIAFMDEFPDVTFLQSQPAAYRAVEKVDPPLFKRIQERVREGRWELVGGTFSEGDTNMSSGEALCRAFLIGQRYFLSRFGKSAVVGWQPDNFGHVAQMPQLLRLAGCAYYYCCRTTPHKGTSWWEGPDGSRVLLYSNDNYNGQVTADVLQQFGRFAPKTLRMFHPTGVGDHGGGPTRRDIESAHQLDDVLGGAVRVRFTTAEDFFRAAEKEMATRPSHRGEMQYIFEGCYTSIARVKEGNRRCEAALGQAERLAVLRRFAGDEYPAEALRRAWEIVLFNEFHDILCGSAINESNADSVADYKWARMRAEDVRDTGLRALADEIRLDPAKGQPIVVFNSTPRAQTSIVEAEVFTHDFPATATFEGWGSVYQWHRVKPRPPYEKELQTVMLRDPQGKAVPAQIVWGKQFPPGFRWKLQFLAEDLPAGGYRTYYLDAAKPGRLTTPVKESRGQFETDYFKVGFDMKTGEIKRLLDKKTSTELVARGRSLNRLRIHLEKPHGMSAWTIGPVERTEDVSDVENVTITERGPVRACVEAVKRWGRSKFIQRTYVYRSVPRIDMELEAHWFEQGDAKVDAPMLRAVFPLALKDRRFDCHTPFAALERPTTGQEVPAQQWVDVSDGKRGVALLTRTKYGYSVDKSELRLTLLRSSYDPDIYPDQGLHRIQYALFPHAGGWQRGRVWNEGELFDGPAVLALEPPSLSLGQAHATRPEEASLFAVEPANVILSGMKAAEDGSETVIRLAEVEGKAVRARVTLPGNVHAARRLDLIERPLADVAEPRCSGDTVEVDVKPHEIVTLGVRE